MTSIMNHKIYGKMIYVLNILLIVSFFYLFCLLSGKYCLHSRNFTLAEWIFKLCGSKQGYITALVENKKFEKLHAILSHKAPPQHEGIFAWAQNNFPQAIQCFKKSGDHAYLAYALFKNGNIDEAKTLSKKINVKKITAHIQILENNFNEAIPDLLKNNDYSGLFKIFLKLDNYPTAIYYLLKKGNANLRILADLLRFKETESNLDISPFLKKNDYETWFYFLKLDMDKIKNIPDLAEQKDIFSLFSFLSGNKDDFFSHFSENYYPFMNQLVSKKIINNEIENNLIKSYEELKSYSFVPDHIMVGEFDKKILMMFSIGLSLLLSIFFISLFYLYRQYLSYKTLQRQKDLEKMDALSIAKIQNIEAKKKRDKTELNVSSFVTLNIQMEVLDLAFTKLGLRVNPKKLQEELEKSKIPNISYKIYTISNAYGLNVKMLSVPFNDLPAQTENGAVILVLKGDLMALLKNADSQNAYLQFSQKDSRKVPQSALKLSWEGNIILLNKI